MHVFKSRTFHYLLELVGRATLKQQKNPLNEDFYNERSKVVIPEGLEPSTL